MTKHTARDEVWNHALRYALLEESFSIQRIRSDMTTRASFRTIRDTLNFSDQLKQMQYIGLGQMN
ncbi:hypothetical protein DU504_15890 [Haloplanus salinus]|uniref:Uncharacterized protein n=1 Tax=Haloplanus salinus TaxID=1126245 RepID=A0A368N426_9EURY|nr:hypothetical protein DU504_15890 [Haloplanus salinus]